MLQSAPPRTRPTAAAPAPGPGHRAALARRVTALALATVAALAAACGPPDPRPDPEAHAEEVRRWKAERLADLRREDGWLSLVGLYWLEEGDNTFGSDPSSSLAYRGDGAPPALGTFTVRGDEVRFSPAAGVEVATAGGEALEAGAVVRSPDGPATEMRWGPLRWFVISRGDRLGVRLKSSQSPVLTGFEGIETYPVDVAWRVPGRFEAYDPPRTIRIPNVLGYESETPARGAAVFEVDGEEYRLDVWRDSDDPDNHFTAFADATNGDGTYGGGRFLWIDAPDEDGRIVVDFNRAYNPPCVFTEYATCPLPPRQNRLPFAVPAGEKEWGEHAYADAGGR